MEVMWQVVVVMWVGRGQMRRWLWCWMDGLPQWETEVQR